MDFFIKAGYAAAQLQDEATSNSLTTAEGFFDDPRIWIIFLSLILSVVSLGWQIKKHFQDRKEHKEGYWHQSVILPLFIDIPHAVTPADFQTAGTLGSKVFLLVR